MPQVAITAAKDLQTATCIQLLHSAAALPLPEAKQMIARLLQGKPQEVTIRSEPDARLLIAALHKLGASAHIKPAS